MIKEVGRLFVGGVGGQLVQFLAMPVLALLYTPDELGFYFTALAFSSVLVVVVSAQAQHAIPTCVLDEELADIVTLVLCLSGMVISLAIAWTILFGFVISGLVQVVIVVSVFSTLNLVIRSFYVRDGSLAEVANSLFLRGASIAIFQIVFSFYSYGLILGVLFGEALCLFYMLRKKTYVILMCYKSKWLKRVWGKYRVYFVTGTTQELVSTAVFQFPIITIPIVYTLDQAGQFGFAHRLIWPPLIILSASIVNVVYSRYGKKNLCLFIMDMKVFLKYYPVLVLLVVVTSCVMPFLFGLLFSEQWKDASNYSLLISLWAGSFLLSSPFRAACRLYRLQRFQLLIDSFNVVIMILLLCGFVLFSKYGLTPYAYVAIMCVVGVIQNFVLSYIVFDKGRVVEAS